MPSPDVDQTDRRQNDQSRRPLSVATDNMMLEFYKKDGYEPRKCLYAKTIGQYSHATLKELKSQYYKVWQWKLDVYFVDKLLKLLLSESSNVVVHVLCWWLKTEKYKSSRSVFSNSCSTSTVPVHMWWASWQRMTGKLPRRSFCASEGGCSKSLKLPSDHAHSPASLPVNHQRLSLLLWCLHSIIQGWWILNDHWADMFILPWVKFLHDAWSKSRRIPHGWHKFHVRGDLSEELHGNDTVSLFVFLCSPERVFEMWKKEGGSEPERERWHLGCEMRNLTILKLWKRISSKPVGRFPSLSVCVSCSTALIHPWFYQGLRVVWAFCSLGTTSSLAN